MSKKIDCDSEYDINNDFLNDDWIKEFKKIDKDYQDYYLDNLIILKISYVYIDKNNDIVKVKNDKIVLNEYNVLSKEELIKILKRNTINDNIKYTLLSILKYNIDLEPNEIKNFINECEMNIDDNYLDIERFLKPITFFDNIIFKKSISMFQDLNELIIVFHEDCIKEKKTKHNITKRVLINRNIQNINGNLKNKNRKTRRLL